MPRPVEHVTDMKPRYLVISLGKSGANWLNNIISALPDIEKYDMGANGITGVHLEELGKLTPGSSMYCHLLYSDGVSQEIRRQNIRPFYIYRDIRDVVVSEYFHKAYLDEGLKDAYPVLHKVNDKTAFDFDNLMQWSTTLIYYYDALNWIWKPDVPKLRFEDLVNRPVETISKALAFHGMTYSRADIEAAIDRASFKSMSGGRSPGQEDRRNHFRKGIVGDWMNYLSYDQHHDIWSFCGSTLRRAGYENAPLRWRMRKMKETFFGRTSRGA